ncbi:MAG TPA: hypothetical protein PLN69_02600 [bacterium]|nr:hypothetical protein [bacterium]
MKKTLFFAFLIIMGITIIANAESAVPPQGEERPAQLSDNEREEYRNKLKQRVLMMISWEIADQMALPPEKEARFLDEFRSHMKSKDKLAEKHAALMLKIKQISDNDELENKEELLKENLEMMDQLNETQKEIDGAFKEKLKEMLTVEQQAVFFTEWPKAKEKVMNLIQNEREKRKQKMKRKQNMKNKNIGKNGMLENQ